MKYVKKDLGDQIIEFLRPVTIDQGKYIYVKLVETPETEFRLYRRIKIRDITMDGCTVFYSSSENDNLLWQYIMREAHKEFVMNYLSNQHNHDTSNTTDINRPAENPNANP